MVVIARALSPVSQNSNKKLPFNNQPGVVFVGSILANSKMAVFGVTGRSHPRWLTTEMSHHPAFASKGCNRPNPVVQ